MPAFPGITVAVQATNLVYTRMYSVRIINGLFWLVRLLATQANCSVCNIVATYYKYYYSKKRNVDLVFVEWNLLRAKNSFLVIRELFQVIIYLHSYQGDNCHDKGDDAEDDPGS